MRKIYEIWCEGDPSRDYTACHLGYGMGSSFEEACFDLASRSEHFREWFNVTTKTYKRCELFDSYEKAIISYG